MQDSGECTSGGGKAGSRGQEGQQSRTSFWSVGDEVAQATGAIMSPHRSPRPVGAPECVWREGSILEKAEEES